MEWDLGELKKLKVKGCQLPAANWRVMFLFPCFIVTDFGGLFFHLSDVTFLVHRDCM